VLVAVPLGLALERARRGAEPALGALGVVQTIPSIALLAFMIPLLGVGVRPALVALWLYALYPIARGTFVGVTDADPRAVEAAAALGMTARQRLLEVRLPLAAPVIMAGVRTAAVITVGAATLVAFIGAGGLGEPIVTGLALADTRLVLSGAVPAALLALVIDALLGLLARRVAPAHRRAPPAGIGAADGCLRRCGDHGASSSSSETPSPAASRLTKLKYATTAARSWIPRSVSPAARSGARSDPTTACGVRVSLSAYVTKARDRAPRGAPSGSAASASTSASSRTSRRRAAPWCVSQ
jgi:ABC-type proline/glycine betaine transport system permease subunit